MFQDRKQSSQAERGNSTSQDSSRVLVPYLQSDGVNWGQGVSEENLSAN